MSKVVHPSPYRWLRLGCLTLALGCGGDDPDTGKVIDEITGDGDGDTPTGDGDATMSGDGDDPTQGDGDATMSGDGDDPTQGDGDAPMMGDGDGDSADAGAENPGPSEAFSRGKDVADKQQCTSCHQDDFAGLGFFPNLTPDATGLKSWSDAQIKRAITEGVGNDGKTLCSGMPKFELTDGEVADLIAFLRGLPAVKKEIKSVCPGHGK